MMSRLKSLSDAALLPVLRCAQILTAHLQLIPLTGTPTERFTAALQTWLSSRDKLIRKQRVSRWFWLFVTLHVVLGMVLLLHPVLFSRDYDGWVFLLLMSIVVHWSICYGECVLSIVEKKLFYDEYAVGMHPLHQWYMDIFSERQCVAIGACIAVAWLVCIWTLILRNIHIDTNAGILAWRLAFAGTGRALRCGVHLSGAGAMVWCGVGE